MGRYLYGASIQGIQSYIFQTNELKDIIGASELVNKICDDFVDTYGEKSRYNGEMIVHAAGNIKCIFNDEDACRKAVHDFPRHAMEMAPGITISQAVVTLDDDSKYACKADELEKRLHAQRNHPVKSLTTGLMAIERSRTTGLPATTIEGKEFLDEGTVSKRGIVKIEKGHNTDQTNDLYFKLTGNKIEPKRHPYDTKDLTDRNDWIAVIHADGNGLGEVVATIKDPDAMRKFSENLDKATIAAARAAYAAIKEENEDSNGRLPIRPIVIGGDDLTVICRGGLAVKFVTKYLEEFEKKTEEEQIGRKLTACAGIAFIKSSYPFYYGYDLAEALCGEAKKDAKSKEIKDANSGQAPSCLMFHKVQSSFVEDYAEIKRKELSTADGCSLCFGPYYLNEQSGRWTIEELSEKIKGLAKADNNRVKTAIRQWLTLMHEDAGAAGQHTKRVMSVISGDKSIYDSATTGIIRQNVYPAYDILSLLTITEQETK